jgi:tripartite ATP-independent transporter DctM subunit
MRSFQNHAEKIFDWIVAIAMVALNVAVFIQVVSRYIFDSPIDWTDEMARLLFIWISFMGAFLALKTKGHIAVETLLHSLFKPAARVYVTAIADFLILYFCIYLAYMGVVMMQKTTTDLTPVMLLPFSYLYAAIALSGALMAIYLLIRAYSLERKTLIVSFLASVVLCALFYFVFGRGDFSTGNLIAVMLVSFFIFIAAGMPIAFAIGIGSLQFLLLYQKIPLVVTHTRLFGGVDSFPLLAVPFFILAGELMNIGGVTVRLVALAKVLVGHIRGGLGMVVVVAEYFFSGISGSTVADVSAIASLLIPAMKKAGYSSETCVSIVSAATAMGILVPPCILMVVLGGMTGISVGALFMGGFLPAIVISLCIMALIYYQAVRANIPVEEKATFKEVVTATGGAIVPLMLPVIILGGIIGGAATPTEISVIAVLYAFILGKFGYGEIKWSDLVPILLRSSIMTGSVMFLVGTSSILSWILSIGQIPQMVGQLIIHLSSSPLVFLLLCNLTFIIIGCILEGLPAMLILVPIFLPLTAQFGVSQLHFGILVIASLGIGLFLPPLGMGMYIACAFAKLDIGKSIVPFMPYLVCLLVGLFIITAFPWFTLVLPGMFFQ